MQNLKIYILVHNGVAKSEKWGGGVRFRKFHSSIWGGGVRFRRYYYDDGSAKWGGGVRFRLDTVMICHLETGYWIPE